MIGNPPVRKVLCPECQKEGKRSVVNVGHSVRTLMAVHQYYDEEGNFHVDDPNVTTTSYSCTNGHRWSETR